MTSWTPSETLNVIGALAVLITTLATSIIAIFKSIHNDNAIAQTDTKTNMLSDRVNSQAQTIRDTQIAITQTALATVPPMASAPAVPAVPADADPAVPAKVVVVNKPSSPVPTTDAQKEGAPNE